MRPLNSLTLETVRDRLSGVFRQIPDSRRGDVNYLLHDVLMTGFAMLYFQHPSLLRFQEQMKEKKGRCNLETVFKVKTVPSDSQMREILDGVPIEYLRSLLPELFERMRRLGWTKEFVTSVGEQKDYTMLLDGSEYFHSTEIECPGCLRKADKNGQINYSHQIVAATLVKAGTHQVLPLDVEEVRNTDGTEKQDCEINAGKRLIERVRQEHRQLALCAVGDALYAHEPFVVDLRQKRMKFVLAVKEGSHKETFEWVEELERMGECERGEWQEGPAAKRHYFEYRIARQVPLKQDGEVLVDFLEVWVRDSKGNQIYHNSWVTDMELTRATVATVFWLGRSRWKIENEQFNVQKNHGYHLEHNYGHGNKTLSMVFYMLNLLAFVTHLILELGDRLYQECRLVGSRRGLWESLRGCFQFVLVESWAGLLQAILDNRQASP